MSKKAPDTRGKLDNNRPVKKKTSPSPKRGQTTSLKELKSRIEGTPVKLKAEKKPTKGQLFKQAHGYSKTMKRNMRKKGVITPEEYKPIRKSRKLAERKIRQKKHADSVAYKRVNGKGKGKKVQNQPKKEKKK